MSRQADGTFRGLCESLTGDGDVLGYFLTGSRGKGFATDDSDYDLVLVVRNDAIDSARRRYPRRYDAGIECLVYSIDEFREYACFGSATAWDRYSFTHVSVLFDRTGGLQDLVDSKGRIPPEVRLQFLAESLDAYVNSVYRSFKRAVHGDWLGSRLEAAESIPYLLAVLFAVEGRHAPFPGYLRAELDRYPLKRLSMPTQELTTLLDSILTSADVSGQQILLREVERAGREEGLSKVFDGWGESFTWMSKFRLDQGDESRSESDGCLATR